MKAILVEHDELVWADAPEPELGPGQVRIDNHATAVNRADLAQTSRWLSAASRREPHPGLGMCRRSFCDRRGR